MWDSVGVRTNFLAVLALCVTLTLDLSGGWSQAFKHHHQCQHQLGASFENDKLRGLNFQDRRRGEERREPSMLWMGGEEVKALTSCNETLSPTLKSIVDNI